MSAYVRHAIVPAQPAEAGLIIHVLQHIAALWPLVALQAHYWSLCRGEGLYVHTAERQ